MNRSIRIAFILGLLSIPSLAGAAGADQDGDDVRRQCGAGFVPVNGPERSAGSVEPGSCADADHPTAPHVHADGRWIGHADAGDPRYQLARPFEHGQFRGATGHDHIYTLHGRRGRFAAAGASFSLAPFESRYCDDWGWDTEPIAIYEDADHSGWYLAYSMRLGTFVHVQLLGPAEAPTPSERKPSVLMRVASFLVRGASSLGK
jgi:hypothetical protein